MNEATGDDRNLDTVKVRKALMLVHFSYDVVINIVDSFEASIGPETTVVVVSLCFLGVAASARLLYANILLTCYQCDLMHTVPVPQGYQAVISFLTCCTLANRLGKFFPFISM